MAPKRKKRKVRPKMDRESWLRCEYEKCFDTWQFGVSLRFTTLAFWLTLTSGLLVFFFSNAELLGSRSVKYVISAIGLVVTLAVSIIETRNRQIYGACIERAKAIEVAVKTTNNLAAEREQPTLWQNFRLACRIRWHGYWKSRYERKCKAYGMKLERDEGCINKLEEAHKAYGSHLLAPEDNNLAVMLVNGIPPHTFSRHTNGIFWIYLAIGLLWVFLIGLTMSGRFDPSLSPERSTIERILEALEALIR